MSHYPARHPHRCRECCRNRRRSWAPSNPWCIASRLHSPTNWPRIGMNHLPACHRNRHRVWCRRRRCSWLPSIPGRKPRNRDRPIRHRRHMTRRLPDRLHNHRALRRCISYKRIPSSPLHRCRKYLRPSLRNRCSFHPPPNRPSRSHIQNRGSGYNQRHNNLTRIPHRSRHPSPSHRRMSRLQLSLPNRYRGQCRCRAGIRFPRVLGRTGCSCLH